MADNVTLTTKQKVIAILTVIIFAFIIYEVIGFFSSEKQAEPVITPVKPASFAQSKQTTTVRTQVKPGTAAAGKTPGSPQPVLLAAVPAITVNREGIDFQKQREQQQNYLDSVNQLQLLKVKREIAETNQAIAAARLATETANKTMSDLLTQPAVMPVPPAGNFAGKTEAAASSAQPAEQSAPPPPPQVLDVPFTVVSVSMQMNRWNAVLGYQDKLYSVTLGDSLFDGSKVASINKSGVTLVKDGKRRRISIQTTI